MPKYTNTSLDEDIVTDLMAIGDTVLKPYGVAVTIPAVIRYMIIQQKALIVKNEEVMKEALKGFKE